MGQARCAESFGNTDASDPSHSLSSWHSLPRIRKQFILLCLRTRRRRLFAEKGGACIGCR